MATVFLSYSTKDHFFAELAGIKLGEASVNLWRDQGKLRAGADWRNGIERGISESIAVIVALSSNSAESSYVTFEWAYGLGKGKPVIPIKLNDCSVHPRLETIQYLDFTIPGALPWASLIERIREIEAEVTPDEDIKAAEAVAASAPSPVQDVTVKAILAYLDQRGYQMASFERLRRRIDESLTDKRFNEIIVNNPTVFRRATLKDAKPGLAKLIP
jgi:TIR domain